MNFVVTWPLLVAISVLSYSISVILQKRILRSKTVDPVAISFAFQFLGGVVIVIAALIHGFVPPDFVRYWPNFLLMMALYSVGNIFIFKALKIIDASTLTIIFTSRALWTIVGAILFLGESFTAIRLLGTALIIASIVAISWQKKNLRLGRGELYCLFAAICFGFAFVNDGFIVRGSDVLSYEGIAFILSGVASLIIWPRAVKKVSALMEPRTFWPLLVLSVLYGLSGVAVVAAYKLGHNAAQIAPLAQTTTIVTVILSIIFLGEKKQLVRKGVGALVSFIGVVLVG